MAEYIEQYSFAHSFIETNKSPQAVFGEIGAIGVIDGNDNCLICPSSRLIVGRNDQEVIDWLNSEGLA